jgi:hypothetical protein
MWTVLAPYSCKQPLSATLSRHYNVVLSSDSIAMLIQVSNVNNEERILSRRTGLPGKLPAITVFCISGRTSTARALIWG